MVRPSGTEAPGARKCGQADVFDELRARLIPKALLADSWGDSRIVAGLIQDGMEDLRHAISGQIARGLFG